MSSILKELRKANIVNACSLGANLGEVWDINIHDNSTLSGTKISELPMPSESKVCALIRDNKVYFDLSDKTVQIRDRLICFCSPSAIKKTERIFA